MRTRKRRRIYRRRRKVSLPTARELRVRLWAPPAAAMLGGILFLLRWGGLTDALLGAISGFGLVAVVFQAIDHKRLKKQPKPKIRPRKYLPARKANEHVITRVWRWWKTLSKVQQAAVSVATGTIGISLVFLTLSGGNIQALYMAPFGAIIGLAMYIGGRRGAFN